MEKIILDTSVILKWFIKEENSPEAKKILVRLENQKIQIFLPELSKYELGNGLLKGKQLPFSKVKPLLISFYNLPITFIVQNQKLSLLTYQIAEKLNITYYDASFLALAKQQNATLITANPKHQKKIAGIKIQTLI